MASLKELLKSQEIVVAPGCHDPLSAKIVESLGFDAVYLGGWAVGSQMAITEPLTTLTEIVAKSKYITDSIDIPLIVDGNACFGDATMATRTVKEFTKAGVSAIHIEDQVIPKRAYYHKNQISLIPIEEMKLKLKIANESRLNDDFVIIARTDAGRVKGESFDHAIERANILAEENPDLLMVFPRTMEEVERAPKEINGDLVFVASEGLGRPIPSVESLKEMGYKMVIYPFTSIIAMHDSLEKIYSNLKNKGHPGHSPEEAEMAANKVMDMIDLPELYAIEDMYLKE